MIIVAAGKERPGKEHGYGCEGATTSAKEQSHDHAQNVFGSLAYTVEGGGGRERKGTVDLSLIVAHQIAAAIGGELVDLRVENTDFREGEEFIRRGVIRKVVLVLVSQKGFIK